MKTLLFIFSVLVLHGCAYRIYKASAVDRICNICTLQGRTQQAIKDLEFNSCRKEISKEEISKDLNRHEQITISSEFAACQADLNLVYNEDTPADIKAILLEQVKICERKYRRK